jgi:hypothetical protein
MTNTDFFKETHKRIAFLLYLKERAMVGLTEPIRGKILTFDFIQCEAGNPPLGNKLLDDLQKILGPNVEIRIYQGGVSWVFGMPSKKWLKAK